MVPNGWEIGNFSSLGIKTIDGDRGKNYPKKDEYLEDGYCLFLGADNVSSNGLMLDKKTFLTREKHEQLGNGVVKYDDLLLIMRGNGTGRVCIYDRVISSYENARINSGLIIIRLNPDFLDKNFALQLMRSSFVIKQFESFMFGSAQPQLTVKILKSLKLPRPTLPEQRKIAKTLSIWDKAISTTEKLIETCKQQKKALMQQLLTGKKRLVNPDTGKAFEGEWEEVKLGDVCSKVTDGAHHSPKSVECGYPMFSVKDMRATKFSENTARYISKEDYEALVKQNCKPELNDILIAKDGSILKYCFVVREEIEGVILSSIALLRPKLSIIAPNFIAQYFSQESVRFFVGKALTSGSGVPRIILKDFKSIHLRIPSLLEQQKIASVLTAADKEIEVFEAKLDHFKQEKKALMQQSLTGKRRVKVDDMEVV